MKRILNRVIDTFGIGILYLTFPLASLFGTVIGLINLTGRSIKAFMVILVCFTTVMTGYARPKDFDKNAKIVDSKEIELTTRQYDCQVSFTILIDSETSRQDVYLKFVFYAKKSSVIDVNGNLLLGCKGEPKFEYEPHHFNKGRSDNYSCLKVWYPLEDIEEFFDCNKARLQTVTGNIDIEFSRSQVKDLQRNYEKAVKEATTIYKTNTDITFGF